MHPFLTSLVSLSGFFFPFPVYIALILPHRFIFNSVYIALLLPHRFVVTQMLVCYESSCSKIPNNLNTKNLAAACTVYGHQPLICATIESPSETSIVAICMT